MWTRLWVRSRSLHCGGTVYNALDLATLRPSSNCDHMVLLAYACRSPQRIRNRHDRYPFHRSSFDLALHPSNDDHVLRPHLHSTGRANSLGPSCPGNDNLRRNSCCPCLDAGRTPYDSLLWGRGRHSLLDPRLRPLLVGPARVYIISVFSRNLHFATHSLQWSDHVAPLDTGKRNVHRHGRTALCRWRHRGQYRTACVRFSGTASARPYRAYHRRSGSIRWIHKLLFKLLVWSPNLVF